jgi:hypothetical protein
MVLGSMDHGFAGNIGFSNILHAELMVVYHGLVLVWGWILKSFYVILILRQLLN